jgi:diaminopimelate decarboxylase
MKLVRDNLEYRKNELYISGFSVSHLAEKYGTPLYVTDGNMVINNFEKIKNFITSITKNNLIAYAYKANYISAITKLLASLGSGATVVSAYGIKKALDSGVKGEDIIIVGPSKSQEDLKAAIESGALINIESEEELADLKRLSMHKKVRIGIRINPNIEAGGNEKIRTGTMIHKFGVSPDEGIRLFNKASKMDGIIPYAFHTHIGSQILSTGPYLEEVKVLSEISARVRKEFNLCVEALDLGGGFGIPYNQNDNKFDYDKLSEEIKGAIESHFKVGEEPKIIIEPGRAIVGDSTILLTKINYTKKLYDTNWLLVDAGMNDFMRPALFSAIHTIIPVKKTNRKITKYSVGGPVCVSSDVFVNDLKINLQRKDEYLAILDTGAYGISMASNYNTRPIPRNIFLLNKEITIVREKDSYNDIFRNEYY